MRKFFAFIASFVLTMTLTGSVLAQDEMTINLVNVDSVNPFSGDPGCHILDRDYFGEGTEEVSTSGPYQAANFLVNGSMVWEFLGHGSYNTADPSMPLWWIEFTVNCDQQEALAIVQQDIANVEAEGTYQIHGLVPYLSSKVFGLITNEGQFFGQGVDPATNDRCHSDPDGGGLFKNAGTVIESMGPEVFIRGQIHDDAMGTPEAEIILEPGSYTITKDGVHLRTWDMVNCNEAALVRDALASVNRREGQGANTRGFVRDWQTDPEINNWIERN